MTSPTPSLPEDVARVVERLNYMGDGARRYRLHPEHRTTANEAAALIRSLSIQLAEARAASEKALAQAENQWKQWEARALAAEADRDRLAAENERLREALEKLLRLTVFELGDNAGKEPWTRNIERARAALAGKAGEA